MVFGQFSEFQVFNLKTPTQSNIENTRENIKEDEILEIIHEIQKHQREEQNIQKVLLTPDEYLVAGFFNHQLIYMKKIWVGSHNILVMDTTFDICDM